MSKRYTARAGLPELTVKALHRSSKKKLIMKLRLADDSFDLAAFQKYFHETYQHLKLTEVS